MSTLEFCNVISTEQHRIRIRCEEIDGTAKALENERRALEEREQALDAVRALYQASQPTLDEAQATQMRLSAVGDVNADGEFYASAAE